MSITYFMMTINESYLHCITLYIGTCGKTAMGLWFDPIVTKIYNYIMMSRGSNGYFVIGASYLNGDHGYGFSSSVGHLKLDLNRLLVYDDMHTISGASLFIKDPSRQRQPNQKIG
jgi:hypothetical protein